MFSWTLIVGVRKGWFPTLWLIPCSTLRKDTSFQIRILIFFNRIFVKDWEYWYIFKGAWPGFLPNQMLYFFSLHCFINAFLMFNQNFSVNFWVMGNDPDLTNICYVNTTCPMFLFALEQYTGKSCFLKTYLFLSAISFWT